LRHDINSSAIDKYDLDGTGFVDAGSFGDQVSSVIKKARPSIHKSKPFICQRSGGGGQAVGGWQLAH
jgi:hypothetical protein